MCGMLQVRSDIQIEVIAGVTVCMQASIITTKTSMAITLAGLCDTR